MSNEASPLNNPSLADILSDHSISPAIVAEKIRDRGVATSERSVRRWRARHIGHSSSSWADTSQTSSTSEPTTGKGTVTVDSSGATINNVVVESPILDDWGPVFALFNLDPLQFEVVDDTVKMSTWQQSKGREDGTRDTIQLYSYSARFRRVNKDMIPQAKVDQWRASLLDGVGDLLWTRTGDAEPTYVILVADPQLGKKGTAEAAENWKTGVLLHMRTAAELGCSAVHVAFMGDEHENVAGSYPGQSHTIELNRTQQLELDFDLSVWTLKKVAEMGLPMSVSSVISNHGEWTRMGMGSESVVTTQNDNSSTYIRRQVRKLFDELAPYGGPEIDWTIGTSTPGVVKNLSGVDCYFSHGYIEKGRGATTESRMQNAVEKQILGRTDELGNVPLWFMAHYHHFYMNTFQDRTLFGCPALEATGSSEYMSNMYGVWSPAGMLGMRVGESLEGGWDHLNVY